MVTDLVGRQFGIYYLINFLGEGGFSNVYLGQHVRLSTKQAAVKVMKNQPEEKLADFQRELTNFQREAETIAQLSHPHIVHILDFGLADGVPFLAMDYCPQGTLRERHASGDQLALPTVVSYAMQIADALQYIHEQNLVHRDIKPANMLIGQRAEILLSDFGIASPIHNMPSVSQHGLTGTWAYMAPELIHVPARPASDQYALAIVVYEWLCGVRPFEITDKESWVKHLTTPPPPLRQYVPDLPLVVEQVVLKALSKKPDERFTTIAEFAQALQEASQPRAVVIEPAQSAWPVIAAVASAPAVRLPAPILHPNLPYTYKGHAGSVNAVAWSPNGKHIASASHDKTVQIWDASNGHHLFTINSHASSVHDVAWSPDGRRIACAYGDKTVQIWSADQRHHLLTYRGHSQEVWKIAWSPDGKRIASASYNGAVHVWDAANGYDLFTFQNHSASVRGVAWSPDGTRIASASLDKTAQVWNAANGRPLFVYGGHTSYVIGVAWSPDSTRIVSASLDKTAQIWDATNGNHLFTYHGHLRGVVGVAWSSDGIHIASTSQDGMVQVWDDSKGNHLSTHHKHTLTVAEVAWSPDSIRIASASLDGTAWVWSAP